MKLTQRENVVLGLIAEGFTDREIAEQLSFSISTARKHRENVLGKFQFRKSSQLVIQYFILNAEALKKTIPGTLPTLARFANVKF
ncbi:response regulator transcription factor [Trinickia violacea]|uniref:response regulator transcription factor n=1 Tax=Trinickia violacea TaxID=2571746 RepID=UPI0020C77E6F|nr:LuxR C-terminal-related transcriptional regulator [Trinickia violacea]